MFRRIPGDAELRPGAKFWASKTVCNRVRALVQPRSIDPAYAGPWLS